MAGFAVGKVCPGIRNRSGAFLAAAGALVQGLVTIIIALISMIFVYRVARDALKQLDYGKREMLVCYYGAGFVVYATWLLFSIIMIAGIKVENKRALFLWLIYTLVLPVYFVIGLILVLVIYEANPTFDWAVGYLILQGVGNLLLIWICLAVWVYLREIRHRDKNPELRENEVLFAAPFRAPLPDGSYNPGYGPGSVSSMARSHKSRYTYAPTESESVRAAPPVNRQSRLDQYRSQTEKSTGSRENSKEREGGAAYYRYQYTAEKQQYTHRSSQGSIDRLRDHQQPQQYQPQQYQPQQNQLPQYQPRQPYQPQNYRQQQGSRESLDQPRYPRYQQNGGSQGSLNQPQRGRYPYSGSQGSLHSSKGVQQLTQPSKDSEV